MDDHLTKPYSRATLAGVIERWVPTARLLGRGDADKECTEPAGERIRSEGSTAPDDVLAPDALEQLASIPGAETSGLVDRVITVYLETSLPLGGVIRPRHSCAYYASGAASGRSEALRISLRKSSPRMGTLRHISYSRLRA